MSAFIVRSIQPRIVWSKLPTITAMPVVMATALASAATAKRCRTVGRRRCDSATRHTADSALRRANKRSTAPAANPAPTSQSSAAA